MSTGRRLSSILARFNWLYSVQRSSSTYRSSWISEHLALLHRLCQQPAEKHQSDSLNLCSYSLSHRWPEVRFDRQTQHWADLKWELLCLVDQLFIYKHKPIQEWHYCRLCISPAVNLKILFTLMSHAWIHYWPEWIPQWNRAALGAWVLLTAVNKLNKTE